MRWRPRNNPKMGRRLIVMGKRRGNQVIRGSTSLLIMTSFPYPIGI
jgi:hypothetical protein